MNPRMGLITNIHKKVIGNRSKGLVSRFLFFNRATIFNLSRSGNQQKWKILKHMQKWIEECKELLWTHHHKYFGVVSFQSFFFP